MNIVISALHFDWRDMPYCLDRVSRDLKVDGVELSWHASFQRPHCTLEDIEHLCKRNGAPNLRLSAHIWDDLPQLGHGPAEQALHRWLVLCGQTGVRQLVLHGGTHPDRTAGVAEMRRIIENAMPEFERAGVVLNLENHYDYAYHDCRELFSTPWEFCEVLSLDSPSLRFCFDTGHGHMTRNTEPLLRELAPWLNYVHLADNYGVNDDHRMLGQGSIDWERVFGWFREIRFDGTFCVEFACRDDRGPFEYTCRTLRRRWAEPMA